MLEISDADMARIDWNSETWKVLKAAIEKSLSDTLIVNGTNFSLGIEKTSAFRGHATALKSILDLEPK